MGFILGFLGGFLLFGGIALAVFGQWGLALPLLSLGIALVTIESVTVPPGWAFKDAHRGSKALWLLIGVISLIPPLGLVYGASWLIMYRPIERARAARDPQSYRLHQLGRMLRRIR